MWALGLRGPTEVALQVRDGDAWNEIAREEIEANSRSVVFRIADWDDAKDTPYRVVYEDDVWEGTVRKDPVDKNEIVVAAFTGNNDLGFPHADIVRNVKHFDPEPSIGEGRLMNTGRRHLLQASMDILMNVSAIDREPRGGQSPTKYRRTVAQPMHLSLFVTATDRFQQKTPL